MSELNEKIKYYNEKFDKIGYFDALRLVLEENSNKSVFTSSLGLEDQALTDILAKLKLPVRIVTLDTGRLFLETYNLWEKTERRYGVKIEAFFPDYISVQKMVLEKGVNLFYESIENRKLCCDIRKMEPLNRAIKGEKIWITGLRADQSTTRVNMNFAELDNNHNIIKINPLINWSLEETWNYIKEQNVPYNPLHDENYPSIGCAPCTRAIMEGEDIRAGRWWWESPDTKECGLHIKDGVLISKKEK
ncbi:MAG: phosphoadenylyl-sulfate reductase [Leptospiraceae bacterium]|nr:phosphoadenylyl-sulfate reductase [Leptospiraceae bacterium]